VICSRKWPTKVEAELRARFDEVLTDADVALSAAESREAMGMTVVENLTAFFDGREPPKRVA